MKRSKSVVDLLLFPMKSGHGSTDYDIKSKNIRHTEILINLRDVILRVANYFQVADPATFSEVNLIADYTVEGHARDNEVKTEKKQATERLHRMQHRIWKETKQQPGTAGPGNMLG